MIRSELGDSARQLDRCPVKMRETAFRVGRVDRRRQGVDNFAKVACVLAQGCSCAQKIYVLSSAAINRLANRVQVHGHCFSEYSLGFLNLAQGCHHSFPRFAQIRTSLVLVTRTQVQPVSLQTRSSPAPGAP
jgi:hypothetical protein